MSIRSGHQLVTPTGPAQRLLIAIGVACFLPVASDAITGQDTVLETAVIYPQEDGCSQLYSPTVLQDAAQPGLFHMWCGGWKNCADRDQYGNDRIYHSTSTNLRNWTAPTSVINSAGYHFNDPSVIAVSYPAGSPSAQLVYLMYLTGCTTVTDCYTTGHNVTYGATSYDGVTWSTPQLVIGINNGLNNGGAWSPSAVKISESLVYLYFFVNTNDPATDGSVQRATINPQVDFFRATSPIRVVLPYHVNPDVLKTASGYEMLYDSGTPFRINRLKSTDGITFVDDSSFPGINGAPNYRAQTGHAFPVPGSPQQYWLYFGWGTAPVADPIVINGWRWQRP